MSAAKLDEIIAEFVDWKPGSGWSCCWSLRKKLLPLPERLSRHAMCWNHRISECQTLMFIWVELVARAGSDLCGLWAGGPTVVKVL